MLIKVTNNVITFFLALQTQEKDGTSSSLKNPRQSTKEIRVNLGIAAISVGVKVKELFMSQICCASALFEPCLQE